ncbi:hypothetical protein, partial [Rhodococcus sp. IEGM 1379]|uniref:hypothetical protein n=1 Tax=Rhodococcus sp. IEGM 1379 TaxID=3047086 RepID=UPI0024B77137
GPRFPGPGFRPAGVVRTVWLSRSGGVGRTVRSIPGWMKYGLEKDTQGLSAIRGIVDIYGWLP